jgi:thymidylate kinase
MNLPHVAGAQMTSGAGDHETIPIVAALLLALEREEVGYCHWKSNDAIARSASGENDLDLLVRRSDATTFLEIMHRLDFKRAIATPDKRLPGVVNFYGYDFEAARWVHVHVHFQLIVGHDATKNYCLPLERLYLRSTRRESGFLVPEPEIELVVLVLRLVLKYCTWDAMLLRQSRPKEEEEEELAFLEERADMERMAALLTHHLPFLGTELFFACREAAAGRASAIRRVRIGQALKRALRPYARRGGWGDVGLKVRRRISLGFRRKVLGRGRRKPRLSNGGAIIAVVGGDGAGKSTVVEALHEWLSAEFDVIRVHMGKPPRSGPTWVIQRTRALLGGLSEAVRGKGSRTDALPTEDTIPTASGTRRKRARLSRILFEVSVARDRHTTFCRAKRVAMNGGLVLCDRFPLQGVELPMDAPQVEAAISSGGSNSLTRFLARLESSWYRAILPPDVLVVLRLDPDIAVRRKTDEGSDYVRMRSEAVWNADFGETPAVVMDASRPKEALLSELRKLVWSRI